MTTETIRKRRALALSTAEQVDAPANGIAVAGDTGLSPQMQRHVDRTLAADRKGGEALWEKAIAVADARDDARRGEWAIYLERTGQHERAAQRLIAIADRGRDDARFRDGVISGWLNFSVAALTAQADEQLLDQLLAAPAPPTRREVEALTNPTPVSAFSPPAQVQEESPPPSAIRVLVKGGGSRLAPVLRAIPPLALVQAWVQGPTGMVLDLVKVTITHIPSGRMLFESFDDRADAERKLEQLAALPGWSDVSEDGQTIPDQLSRAVREVMDIPHPPPPPPTPTTAPPMDFRTRLRDAFLTGNDQAAYAVARSAPADLYDRAMAAVDARVESFTITDALARLDAPTVPICKTCDQPTSGTRYNGQCEGCYHIRQSTDVSNGLAAWHLELARNYTERLPFSGFRTERLKQIAQMIKGLQAPSPSPATMTPADPTPNAQEAPADPTPDAQEAPADPHARIVLLRHAESTLASLIECATPDALRLLHCLIVGIEDMYPADDESVASDLWEFAGHQLPELSTDDLRWIEGKEK